MMKPDHATTIMQGTFGVTTACRHHNPRCRLPLRPAACGYGPRLWQSPAAALRPTGRPTLNEDSRYTFVIRLIVRQSKSVKPWVGGGDSLSPLLARPLSRNRSNHSPFASFSASPSQSNHCNSTMPKTANHAVLGSTPAPGVVFRGLAENRARRGISSVRVNVVRTATNHP